MDANQVTGEVGDFATFLATVRPRTNVELAEKLQNVVAAVQDTGKKGSVTLTITIVPNKSDGNVLEVFDQIKESLPEHDRKGSLAYPDKNNNLTRTPPDSIVLFTDESIREAPAAETPGEIRKAPEA